MRSTATTYLGHCSYSPQKVGNTQGQSTVFEASGGKGVTSNENKNVQLADGVVIR